MNIFTNMMQTLRQSFRNKELLATRIWLVIACLIIILLMSDGKIIAYVEQMGQVISNHTSSAADGIDTASVYVESINPAIGLLDNTNGNTEGWYIQAGSTGSLNFQQGSPNEVGSKIFVLQPDGTVCIGACD